MFGLPLETMVPWVRGRKVTRSTQVRRRSREVTHPTEVRGGRILFPRRSVPRRESEDFSGHAFSGVVGVKAAVDPVSPRWRGSDSWDATHGSRWHRWPIHTGDRLP